VAGGWRPPARRPCGGLRLPVVGLVVVPGAACRARCRRRARCARVAASCVRSFSASGCACARGGGRGPCAWAGGGRALAGCRCGWAGGCGRARALGACARCLRATVGERRRVCVETAIVRAHERKAEIGERAGVWRGATRACAHARVQARWCACTRVCANACGQQPHKHVRECQHNHLVARAPESTAWNGSPPTGLCLPIDSSTSQQHGTGHPPKGLCLPIDSSQRQRNGAGHSSRG